MSMIPTASVLVSHKDPLMASGLSVALREQPDFDVRIDTDRQHVDADKGLIWHWHANVVVSDYETALALLSHRGDSCGLQSSASRVVRPCVLVVTHRASECEIRHALEQGVRGYLLSGCTSADLVVAVRDLHKGYRRFCSEAMQLMANSLTRTPLTGRETEVLRLLAQGHCNKYISSQLDIAVGTVKTHVKAILDKLDAKGRAEAAAVADQRGILRVANNHIRPVC